MQAHACNLLTAVVPRNLALVSLALVNAIVGGLIKVLDPHNWALVSLVLVNVIVDDCRYC